MIIYICAFTEAGFSQIEKIISTFNEIHWIVKTKECDLSNFIKDAFLKRLPVLFIGSTGIAVRTIAPFINNKLTDSPVLVMDEMGKFIIPILSGHVGGANKIANLISSKLNAIPVITTATDINNLFSVDVFACENGFSIVNKDGIKKVSSKLLKGEKITISSKDRIEIENKDIPSEIKWKSFDSSFSDILISFEDYTEEERNSLCSIQLKPKLYCVGMGCKKGKSFEELNNFVVNVLGLTEINNIKSISSIDLKKDEIGLITLAQYYKVPFITYSCDELNSIEGNFEESEFVKSITGVSNVCERSSSLSSRSKDFIINKVSENGMTLAVSKTEPKIIYWK